MGSEFYFTVRGKGKAGDFPKPWTAKKESATIVSANIGPLSDANIVIPKLETYGGANVDIVAFDNSDLLFGRCTRELGDLGVIYLGKDGSVVKFDIGAIPLDEAPQALMFLLKLNDRAAKKVTASDHQLSWYDMKQAAGIVEGMKKGDAEAILVGSWADGRVGGVKKARAEEAKKSAEEAKARADEAKKCEAAAAAVAASAVPNQNPSTGASPNLVPDGGAAGAGATKTGTGKGKKGTKGAENKGAHPQAAAQ